MDKLSVLYAFQYLWYVATGKILAQCLCKFFSCASLVGSCYFILFYFILFYCKWANHLTKLPESASVSQRLCNSRFLRYLLYKIISPVYVFAIIKSLVLRS